MITNPETLEITQEEADAFIKILVKHIHENLWKSQWIDASVSHE